MKQLKIIIKNLILFVIGGLIYNLVEIIYRGNTHWTMFLVGGLCFLFIGWINKIFSWELAFWKQMLIGGFIVTVLEFVSGCIINLWLGWEVWDYSNMLLNLLGQVCLPFSVLWVFLSAIAIVLDDYLRYWLFNEEKPKYKIF